MSETVEIPEGRYRLFKILTVVWWVALLVLGLSFAYVFFNLRSYVECPPCDLMTCYRYCNKTVSPWK